MKKADGRKKKTEIAQTETRTETKTVLVLYLDVEKLEELCENEEWSGNKLAEKSGLHRNTIMKLRENPDHARLSTISAIGSAFEIDPTQLLKVVEKEIEVEVAINYEEGD